MTNSPSLSHIDHAALSQLPHRGRIGLIGPLAVGLCATVLFYTFLDHTGLPVEIIQRYLRGHFTEYAMVGMFLIGLCILCWRTWTIWAERSAIAALLPETNDHSSRQFESVFNDSLLAVRSASSAIWSTLTADRFLSALRYLQIKSSKDGLADHLKSESERASDAVYSRSGLLQTMIWAIPILGFLGTVMGITMAIAAITPEQLESSLPEVTAGLAVAFDTTAVALAFSLVLVFTNSFVRRAEEEFLLLLEQRAHHRFSLLIADDATPISSPSAVSDSLYERWLTRTEQFMQRQSDAWESALEQLRSRWSGALSQQESHWRDALQQGTKDALSAHAGSLAAAQKDWIQVSQSLLTGVAAALREADDRRHALHQSALADQQQLIKSLEQHVRSWLDEHLEAQSQSSQALVQQLHSATERFTLALEHSQLREETLARCLESLRDLSTSSGQLTNLQHSLVTNLEAVRAAETFEQTLHSLNAAVHLLTARTHMKAA